MVDSDLIWVISGLGRRSWQFGNTKLDGAPAGAITVKSGELCHSSS